MGGRLLSLANTVANKGAKQMVQQIFQDGNTYYLVQVWDNGKITLKVKENGWSDIWSLPVEECYEDRGGK